MRVWMLRLFFCAAWSSSYNSDAAQPFTDTTLEDGARWPCPGVCWTLFDTRILGTRLSIGLRDFWAPNCTFCQPCGFGECFGLAQCWGDIHARNDGCYTCSIGNIPRTFRPTALFTCTNLSGATMCLKGYYATSDGDSASCVPCVDASLLPSCGDGTYPRRCAHYGVSPCLPCTYPPLQEGQVYGGGALYEDCDGFLVDETAVDVSGCAFFQTPKWEAGYCAVYCAPGYAPLSKGGCARCDTACGAGAYPRTCPGGFDAPLDAYTCLPCNAEALPLNAYWLPDTSALHCAWTCAQGFYAFNGQCMSCALVVGVCDTTNNYYWLGCGMSSAGECRSCASVACVAPFAFRMARVYDNLCHCEPCAAPLEGVTYVASACTPLSDTVLLTCSGACPVGAYQTSACTLWADRQCVACTAPPAGKRLVASCNASQDARYGDCPLGWACDGSATPFACAPPRVASTTGVCVCPLARVEPDCAPMRCSDGLFPDNRTGVCAACAPYMWDTMLMPHSQIDVMGVAACGCPDGYVRTQRGARFDCWPCGDLGCVYGVERQTPCNGFDANDPVCACAPGPGMMLVVNATSNYGPCAMACLPGFDDHGVSSLYYGDHNFVSSRSSSEAHPIMGACVLPIQATLLNRGQFVLAWCGGVTLLIVELSNTTAQMKASALSAEEQLSIEGVRSSIQPIDLVPHGDGLWAWMLFRFWGMCDSDLVNGDTSTAAVRWCVAVEMVTATRCGDGLCLRRSNLWGKTFPVGVVGANGALAVGNGTLFLWRPLLGLHRYAITLYDSQTLYEARADDPLIALVGPALEEGVRSLAYHLGVLYVLVESGYVRCLSLTGDAYVMGATLPGVWSGTVRAWTRLMLTSTQGDLYAWDAPNSVLSAAYAHSVSVLWFAIMPSWRGASTLLGLNATHLVLDAGVVECSWDTFASSASDGNCVSMPCTRASMCDANGGTRALGDTSCGCLPGFFLASNRHICVPCAPPQFCAGGKAPPNACPSKYAETIAPGARSIADCVCVPGTFVLGGQCLECPTTMWCPVHGTLAPVACAGGGWTITYGAITPLECRCPTRTYGVGCAPCDAHMDCSSINLTTVAAMRLVVTGEMDGEARLANCVGGNAVRYSMLGISLTNGSASPSGEGLLWDWVVVLPAYAQSDALTCIASSFTSMMATAMAEDALLPLGVAGSCGGRHFEWTSAGCTCVAGYEAVDLGGIGGVQCLPCLNGTFKAPGMTGGCVACPPELFVHAPFLGMTACVCFSGYDSDSVTGACVAIQADDPRNAPPWLVSMTTLLFMSAGAGAMAMGFACVFGCLAAV